LKSPAQARDFDASAYINEQNALGRPTNVSSVLVFMHSKVIGIEKFRDETIQILKKGGGKSNITGEFAMPY